MGILAKPRTIYMLDGGPGRQYVGQTVDLEKRMATHRCAAKRGVDTHLCRFIRAHGWESLAVKVLMTGDWTDAQANAVEEHFIRLYDTYTNGLNCTLGGGGTSGWSQPQETRDKIAEKARGRKLPPRSREYRIGSAMRAKGRVVSEESKEKNRQAHLGKKASASTREKQSAAGAGKAKRPQHSARVSATHKARGIQPSADAVEKARAVNTGSHPPDAIRFRLGAAGAKFRDANIGLAMEMRAAGKSQRVVAEAIGVSECTISRWEKIARQQQTELSYDVVESKTKRRRRYVSRIKPERDARELHSACRQECIPVGGE